MNLQNLEDHVQQMRVMVLLLDALEMLSLSERADLIEYALEMYETQHLKPKFPKCTFTISCDYIQLNKMGDGKYSESRVKNPQLSVRLKSRASVVDISTKI